MKSRTAHLVSTSLRLRTTVGFAAPEFKFRKLGISEALHRPYRGGPASFLFLLLSLLFVFFGHAFPAVAATSNVRQDPEWTTNISHGELIRSGVDELMEVDPENLRFVFQGASDPEYGGQGFGGIPWRLGILEVR